MTEADASSGASPATEPAYRLSRRVFLRLLGTVYLIAFISLTPQLRGLIGERGILPVADFLAAARSFYGADAFRELPTLLWFAHSDTALLLLTWGGALLAGLLMAGIAPIPVLALLWLDYLSLSIGGQAFLSFQWDALLLETGLLALFYAPAVLRLRPGREPPPPAAGRWLIWWLAFRLMFLSGITKLLSGDSAWRHLTALEYHYWTQPLATVPGWFAAHLPAAVQAASAAVMFVIELGAPLLILTPTRRVMPRRIACTLLVALQLAIAVTGNYGFFNLLAIVLCLALLDDDALRRLDPRRLVARAVASTEELPVERNHGRAIRLARLGAAAALFILASLATLRECLATARVPFPAALDAPLAALAPFRSINGYGLFRVMTTARPEIIVEGSLDGSTWRAYPFRFKPGDPARPPRLSQPYMPRLDWQMWFAALDPAGNAPWLVPFLHRLLDRSPPVLRLLAADPFNGQPPRFIRLAGYSYHPASIAEWHRTGNWWIRDRTADLTRSLTLEDLSAAAR